VALALARIRAEFDLTQAELAARIGLKQPAVARLESGRRAPSTRVLNQIADAFGLDWQIAFVPHGTSATIPAVRTAQQVPVASFLDAIVSSTHHERWGEGRTATASRPTLGEESGESLEGGPARPVSLPVAA
jgi:transcriptional regulator with XRE-family HTH domain